VMIVKRKNKDHSFCFIIFEQEESAKKALKIKKHKVGEFTVECSIAEPKIRSWLNKEKDGFKSGINQSSYEDLPEEYTHTLSKERNSKNNSKSGSKERSNGGSERKSQNYKEDTASNFFRNQNLNSQQNNQNIYPPNSQMYSP
jgi:hypothetical protein